MTDTAIRQSLRAAWEALPADVGRPIGKGAGTSPQTDIRVHLKSGALIAVAASRWPDLVVREASEDGVSTRAVPFADAILFDARTNAVSSAGGRLELRFVRPVDREASLYAVHWDDRSVEAELVFRSTPSGYAAHLYLGRDKMTELLDGEDPDVFESACASAVAGLSLGGAARMAEADDVSEVDFARLADAVLGL